jgi:hypothetical protein
MRRPHALLALVLCAACSSDEPGEDPVYALYGAQNATRLTPYPSNRYTKADPASKTGRRVDISTASTSDAFVSDPTFAGTVAALNRLDGFSTVGPIIVGFSKDIDPASAERERALALVDVDDASPNRGKAVPLITLYFTTTDTESLVDDYTLLAHPVEPLRPRTRYAFVVTDAVKTTTGKAVQASGETRALLRDEPGEYAESVRAALPLVESAAGVKRDAIVLASVFTTETVRDVIETMAIDRRAAPAPKLSAPFTLKTPVTSPDKRARFVARYEAPEYRRPKPNGTFDVANDRANVQSTVALETYLDFSDATRSGPRPIVIYGHGLGGDKDGAWGSAERLAELDVAVIAIDAPEHGSRSDPPTPDGKSDLLRSVTGFFAANPDTKQFDMERVRDNFRQMALDQLELVRLIQSLGTLDVLPIGAPDGIPDIDPTRILYLGHSFGSVLGPTVGALAPEIKAACWNVGGDGLLTLMRDSGLFRLIVNSFTPAGTPKADVAKFFAITQAIVDPGDPANFARFATLEPMNGVANWAPKDVLVQEVKGDTIVPNTATEVLARALGLAQVGKPTHDVPGMKRIAAPATANLPSGATGGLTQFETIDGALAQHGELIFSTEGRKQYVEFFRTALAGRATIIDPYAK